MPLSSADESDPYAPRVRLRRIVLTGAVLLGTWLAALACGELAERVVGRGAAWVVGFGLVPAAVTFVLAPHVSYRRRDSLFCLTGIGMLIVLIIAWRVGYLPFRDWRPRPDEVSRAAWMRRPEHAGIWRRQP